jgi:hypothetical protein
MYSAYEKQQRPLGGSVMGTDSDTTQALVEGAASLLPLPSLDGLSEQQIRGAACIWGGEPLNTDNAVDLGERTTRRGGQALRWFPRACRRDVQTAALNALHEHAPDCEQCITDGMRCDTGRTLNRIARRYR